MRGQSNPAGKITPGGSEVVLSGLGAVHPAGNITLGGDGAVLSG